MEKEIKFFILQQYVPNSKYGVINSFYEKKKNDDEVCWLGHPERATRFDTIGDAMKESTNISERTGVYFKAIPVYKDF